MGDIGQVSESGTVTGVTDRLLDLVLYDPCQHASL